MLSPPAPNPSNDSDMTTGKLHFTDWRKLPIGLTELCIATTLRCGQSFRSVMGTYQQNGVDLDRMDIG